MAVKLSGAHIFEENNSFIVNNPFGTCWPYYKLVKPRHYSVFLPSYFACCLDLIWQNDTIVE